MKSTVKTIDRRELLERGALLGIGALLLSASAKALNAAQEPRQFEIKLTEEEWRKRLSPDQFSVLREEATERRYSSALLNEKRKGTYHCAGCDLGVYSSEAKYESGTGWPSFWESLPDTIGTKVDKSWFMTRTEVHCRRCGGHFGHIFDDGPRPTGKRHCLNGLALTFKEATVEDDA